MLTVKKEGILVKKSGLPFECEGVLNPAVIKVGDYIHMFFRAVGKGNYSTVGYCRLSSPFVVDKRSDIPVLFPQFDYELQGVEDPRIVQIDDLYYLTYTAYDGINALGALAISTDLEHFEKRGILVPRISYHDFYHLAEARGPLNEKYRRFNRHGESAEKNNIPLLVWDKNVIFFPRRIDGKLFFLHRIKPDIQIVSVNSLDDLTPDFWHNYFLRLSDYIVMAPHHKHEVSYIGGGCPPIETDRGWLIIYHGVHDTVNGYVYTACAALLDLNNPQQEIARLPYPLFKPELDWELTGEVNNVCFPTGAIVIDDTIHIYYGAADEQIACASVSLTALLDELLLYTNK